ncbi:deoxymugineic acid synthase 1 [Cryptomeria japonica]|uniref:deoxymugineic acid synthase 1 n=1 Tax=Cryptomeria japonica TaxID=3369 RepID=UPI0027DAA2E6|nr:deoxymugineic acid synthase 1 [Cryptomeria japonica]
MEFVGQTRELNGGGRMPVIGLGTAAWNKFEEMKSAITVAMQVGYRHFDTASYCGSEGALGAALKEAFQSGLVRREEVFVTTKLWGDEHDDPVAAISRRLENLQLEYVDLFLLHWPVSLRKGCILPPTKEDFLPLDIQSTWRGMETCFEMGLTKAIGLSNFSCKKIEDLLSYAKILPAANQVEMHPMWQQKKLRDYCSKKRIQVCVWSPLGGQDTPWASSVLIMNPIIHEIAQKHGKTVVQVLLRWGIEQGVCVVPRGFNKGIITENFQIFDWCLTAEDSEKINKLEQRKLVRAENLVNSTTSPYRTVEELWDGEI